MRKHRDAEAEALKKKQEAIDPEGKASGKSKVVETKTSTPAGQAEPPSGQGDTKSSLNPGDNQALTKHLSGDGGTDYSKFESAAQKAGKVPGLVGTTIAYGQTKSGKTYTLISLLENPQVFKGKYSKIDIFAPTAEIDPSFEYVKKTQKNVTLHQDVSNWESTMEEIEESQGSKKRSKTPLNTFMRMIIFEDATSNRRFINKSKALQKMVTAGRHYNCHFWIAVHKFRWIEPVYRINAFFQLFFKNLPAEELRAFCEENAVAEADSKRLFAILEKCLTEKYNFIFLNKTQETANQFHCKFEKTIDLSQSVTVAKSSAPKKEMKEVVVDKEESNVEQPQIKNS